MNDLQFTFMIIGYFTSAVVFILALFVAADFLMQCYRLILVKRFVETKQMKKGFK